MWKGAGKVQPSVLIVESGSGEVYIVEDGQKESQVERILKNSTGSRKSTRVTKIKTEIKEEPEETAAKSEGEEEDIDELLEEIMSDDESFDGSSPARPDISFVDSSLKGSITPKNEFPDIKTNVPQQAETTFDGRWSSDEQELELEDFADDDISDLEIKRAFRDKKPKKTRADWGKHKKNVLKGRPVCKYCEAEFWTFKAKVEHMEACEFLQCDTKNFICRICFKELSKKTFSNHLHETLDCPHCGKGFVNPRNLRAHILKQHDAEPSEELKQEVQEFQAEDTKSNEVFDDLSETGEEETLEFEAEAPPPKKTRGGRGIMKEKRRFECDRCGKYLVSQFSMMNHIRLHLKKRSHMCENCGEDFYTQNGLKKHSCEKKRRRPEVDYRTYDVRYCRFCDTRFNNYDENKAHTCKSEDPTDSKWVFCRFCNKRLMKNVFNRHMEIHSGVEWRCTVCNRKMSTERALKLHLTTHTGNKPYPCQECSETFINKIALMRHMRFHGGTIKQYSCEVCFKQLSSKVALDAHINRVHNLKIQCELCKAELPSKEELKFHLENDHEPSVCTVCSKAFRLPRYLRMHEKLHFEDSCPKVQCSFCLKLLSIKTIKAHVYRSHNDQFEAWKELNPTL